MLSWPFLACSTVLCHSPAHPATSSLSCLCAVSQISAFWRYIILLRIFYLLWHLFPFYFHILALFCWYNYSLDCFLYLNFKWWNSSLFCFWSWGTFPFHSDSLPFSFISSSFYLVWTICVAERQGEHEQLHKEQLEWMDQPVLQGLVKQWGSQQWIV